jgi:hypothetical protein
MRKLIGVAVVAVAIPLVAFAAPFQIGGPYANHLSQRDIQQITALVSKDSRVDHRLKKLEAVRPDKVHIQTGGRTAVDEDTYNACNVYKRAGRWAIDAASIEISIEKIVLPNNGPVLIR